MPFRSRGGEERTWVVCTLTSGSVALALLLVATAFSLGASFGLPGLSGHGPGYAAQAMPPASSVLPTLRYSLENTTLPYGGGGVTFDPLTHLFYVVDRNGSVVAVNESTGAATYLLDVPSGEYAHIAVDPFHSLGFVVTGISDSLTVFNLTTRTILANLTLTGDFTRGVALDPQKELAFVTNGTQVDAYNYSLWKVVATQVLPNSSPMSAASIAIDLLHRVVGVTFGLHYLALMSEQNLNIVALETVVYSPYPLAYDPASNDFIAGDSNGNNLSLVPENSPQSVVNLTLPGPAWDLEGITVVIGGFDEALIWVYPNFSGGASLTVLNVATEQFVQQINATSGWPASIAVDPQTLVALAVDPLSGLDSLFVPSLAGYTPLTFAERGLPSMTPWSLTVGTALSSSDTPFIYYWETNGTASFSVPPVLVFLPTPASGTLTVAGTPLWQWIDFALYSTPTSYTVAFDEAGLTSPAIWNVNLTGTNYSSSQGTSGASLGFSVVNGTFSFIVGGPSGYTVSPSTGTVAVQGAGTTVHLTFTPTSSGSYLLTFTASGLASGSAWAVTLQTTPVQTRSTQNSSLSFSVTDGSYSFTVTPPTGYSATPLTGSVTVSGSATTVTLAFAAVAPTDFEVTFMESGLPAQSNWSMSFGGVTAHSTGTQITFSVPNGSYVFQVGGIHGYTAHPSNGTMRVEGSALVQDVQFVADSASPAGAAPNSGSLTTDLWYVMLGAGVVAVVGLVLFWTRARARPPVSSPTV